MSGALPSAPPLSETWQAVLDFWFGAPGTPPHSKPRTQWFKKSAAFDASIRQRFLGLHEAARTGALTAWQDSPLSLLALIVVCDQFPRNLFRNTPRAFETDGQALVHAGHLVARGWDRRLGEFERQFAYLPFEHAEAREAQADSLRLFGELALAYGDDDPLAWARKHAAVIERFGRFPHRNAALGRTSTPEETAFLREPGSRF